MARAQFLNLLSREASKYGSVKIKVDEDPVAMIHVRRHYACGDEPTS